MESIERSWDLMKRSFAILQSDNELMLFPIASAISCLLVSAVILGVTGTLSSTIATLAAGNAPPQVSAPASFAVFFLYVANYFVIVFFNLALVGVASSRLSGGTGTLRDGLSLAWERRGKVLQWALLAATVGIILRIVEGRLSWLGRLIVRLVGVAWSLAAYFVVPVLAFEDLGPVDALKRSAHLFRENWGENLAGGFSFGYICGLLALPGVILWFVAAGALGAAGMFLGGVLVVAYFLVLAVVSAAVQGIFMAALYRYATGHEVPPGFRPEHFSKAWHGQ